MKKTLPYSPNRSQVYEMYRNQMSIQVIKKNLDNIIQEYQQKTGTILSVKCLPRAVWVEFIRCFDVPQGYQPQPELLEEKTIFDIL